MGQGTAFTVGGPGGEPVPPVEQIGTELWQYKVLAVYSGPYQKRCCAWVVPMLDRKEKPPPETGSGVVVLSRDGQLALATGATSGVMRRIATRRFSRFSSCVATFR